MADCVGDVRFTYSATLRHEADVRHVTTYAGASRGLVTSSYDKTAKVWSLSDKNEAECLTTLFGHTGWVVAAQEVRVGDETLLATAGWDKNLALWNLTDGTPVWMLDAHTDKVTCIASLSTGEMLTGGYDSMVVIWKDGYVVAKAKRHRAPVACCCALDGGEAVTGGAHGDNSLIRWSRSGEPLATYAGHRSGVRGVARVSATEFVSCSNDASLILWAAASSAALRTFSGHANQVYSVAVLPTGEFVSGSEDKTVKVWTRDGECAQTIAMPSFVFSVAAVEGGDVAAACQDGSVVVFSRNPDRVASFELVQAFEATVASQKLSKGGLSGLDQSKIKSPEELKYPGEKDGQQLFVKQPESGGVEVYCWNKAKTSWEKIGDVMEEDGDGGGGAGGGQPSAAGASQKVAHGGKEWDYVFDVDLTGDGSGMLRLPYNKGENPYEAAQRFIHANSAGGVHQGFLDEIARFIIQNAEATGLSGADEGGCVSEFAKEAARTAEGEAAPSYGEALKKMQAQGTDAAFSEYAKEAAAAGVESTSVSDQMKKLEGQESVAFSTFAQEAAGIAPASASAATDAPAGVEGPYVQYDRLNAAGIVKKLRQQAAEEKPGLPDALLAQLCSAVERAAAGVLGADEVPVEACRVVLQGWAGGRRFAVVDFLRQALLGEGAAEAVLGDAVLGDVAAMLRSGGDGGPAPAAGAEESLCLKAACNCFATARGRQHVAGECSGLLGKLGGVCGQLGGIYVHAPPPPPPPPTHPHTHTHTHPTDMEVGQRSSAQRLCFAAA